MPRGVGIDIGTKSVKVVELESVGNKIKVTKFIEREIPSSAYEENPEVLISSITNIFKEYKLNNNNTAIAVPSQDCILSDFIVEFTNEDVIHKTIKYTAEGYLHSYQIEDVVIDYHKLEVLEKNTKILMAAVPKKIIGDRLHLVQQCDIDPVAIDLDIMALVNAVKLSPQINQKEAVVLVDFGAGSTKVILLFQGQIRYVRSTRLGADRLASTLQKDLEVDYQTLQEKISSQRLPRQEETGRTFDQELILSLSTLDGDPDLSDREYITQKPYEEWEGDWIEQKKEEFFDRLTRELRRTLLACQQMDKPFELICLTGGGSHMEGLPQYIEEKFKIPTVRLDLSDAIQFPQDKPNDIGLLAPIAIGLALKAIGKAEIGMDFRKEEFVCTKRFEVIKIALAITASLLFIISLLLVYMSQNQLEKAKDRFQYDLEIALKAASENRITNEISDEEPINQINRIREILETKIEGGNTGSFPPINSTLPQWKHLFDQVKEIRREHYFTIEEIEINQDKALFKGRTKNTEVLDVLKNQIVKNIGTIDKDDKITKGTTEKLTEPKDPKLIYSYSLEFGFKK